MNSHWIEILDRTNNDHIVVRIAEQFQLKFLPTEQGFLNQHFVDRRCMQTTIKQLVELFLMMHESATSSSKCIRRSYNKWIANSLRDFFSFQIGIRHLRRWNAHVEAHTKLTELLAVFGFLNRRNVNTDDSNAIFGPDTHFIRFFAEIECRLTTHGWQNCINFSFLENLHQRTYRER